MLDQRLSIYGNSNSNKRYGNSTKDLTTPQKKKQSAKHGHITAHELFQWFSTTDAFKTSFSSFLCPSILQENKKMARRWCRKTTTLSFASTSTTKQIQNWSHISNDGYWVCQLSLHVHTCMNWIGCYLSFCLVACWENKRKGKGWWKTGTSHLYFMKYLLCLVA